MKFSAIFVAAAAVLCVSVNAQSPGDVEGKVKGIPLVFDEHSSLRSAQFVKGEPIVHSRSENLATSNLAVPDESNPYRSRSQGVVGEALSMPANNGSGSASSSTAWTTGLAVGGCAVAAVGIAGFVFMKKRTQKQVEEEGDEAAQTPATGSPSNEVADFKDEMQTPVAV